MKKVRKFRAQHSLLARRSFTLKGPNGIPKKHFYKFSFHLTSVLDDMEYIQIFYYRKTYKFLNNSYLSCKIRLGCIHNTYSKSQKVIL